jgi:ketosteroid isomerase-like protein
VKSLALIILLAACATANPVAEIQSQYNALAQSFERQDIPAILAMRHPDFEVFGPNGQHDDYARMAEYTRQWFVTNQPPITTSFEILSADVLSANEVAVRVLQKATRYQDRDGKLRHVRHEVVQRETWVRTPAGWRIRKVDEIDLANRKRWIDGVLEVRN